MTSTPPRPDTVRVAPGAPTKPKRMPRIIKTLHRQIMAHPEYKTLLDDNTRWCYETGCVRGASWCDAQNNKWSRQIWQFLYAGGPKP